MVSITRLAEFSEKMNSQRPQSEIRPDSVRLQILNIELTRETAEWLLADIVKRVKRLQQSVQDPNTKREAKREKRKAELTRIAYAVDAIRHALSQPES